MLSIHSLAKKKNLFSKAYSLLFILSFKSSSHTLFFFLNLQYSVQFSSVTQPCLTLCNPMDCSTQASLFITNTQRLLKLMSIELVMPSNHLILCLPLLLLSSIFPSIRGFSNESVFTSCGQSIGASASASFLLMNIQD